MQLIFKGDEKLRKDYLDLTLSFLGQESKGNESETAEDFLRSLSFLYPSLKVETKLLHQIIKETSLHFEIPYHHIKVIGSAHMGFSFIDKNKNDKVKYYDQKSDIDIAIINADLFISTHKKTFIATEAFTNNVSFKTPQSSKYYRENVPHGFIRPDSIACIEEREKWLNFFHNLSKDSNIIISGALYLDETFFIARLKKSLTKFTRIEEVQNGIK